MNVKNQRSSLAKRSWKKMVSNKLTMIGFIVFVLFILLVVFAPLLTSYSPSKVDLSAVTQAPSLDHILGTDKLGRDIWARILYGGRMSIEVGIISSLGCTFIGIVFGCIGGYFGGKMDAFFVRFSELLLTFPQLILVLIMAALLGQGVSNLIIIFVVTGWMTTFRMVRNEFLVLREETYVEVNKAFGISNLTIMFKQILPNALSPIVVAATLNIAGFILQEASLSFLGVGVPSTVATWGNIMNAAKALDVITNYWWLWVVPGATISLFVLAINFLGDGLRDVLDPKQ